jgi:hypothetical protein
VNYDILPMLGSGSRFTITTSLFSPFSSKGSQMILEAFVGQEISRIHRVRFESEALLYHQSQSALHQSLSSSLRSRLGDAMIRTGCRIAGMDMPACIGNLSTNVDTRAGTA